MTAHSAVARTQRALKLHPGGKRLSAGVIPGICRRGCPRLFWDGTDMIRPRV